MTLARRCLVLIALMFWQGGFTFYASIVVPTGTRVLGSPVDQGLITREVTRDLNLTAAIALLPLLLDVVACRGAGRLRKYSLLALWLFMALCQVLLFVLHGKLDALIDANLADFEQTFRPLHRVYLWTHTVQWMGCLLFIPLMLRGWQLEDRVGKEKGR